MMMKAMSMDLKKTTTYVFSDILSSTPWFSIKKVWHALPLALMEEL